jgi:hypothetical protein
MQSTTENREVGRSVGDFVSFRILRITKVTYPSIRQILPRVSHRRRPFSGHVVLEGLVANAPVKFADILANGQDP